MAGVTPRRWRIEVAGPEPLTVETADTDAASDATPAPAEVLLRIAPTPEDRVSGRIRYEVVVDGWRFEATAEDAALAALRLRAHRAAAEHGPVRVLTMRAQIPGRVAQVFVAEGDTVDAGSRLLSVEAMKMENEIRSPRAGTVKRVAVTAGMTVELGVELVVIG